MATGRCGPLFLVRGLVFEGVVSAWTDRIAIFDKFPSVFGRTGKGMVWLVIGDDQQKGLTGVPSEEIDGAIGDAVRPGKPGLDVMFLEILKRVQDDGKTEERSFGKIRAFKVLLEGKQSAAIILPERTAHAKNEIELFFWILRNPWLKEIVRKRNITILFPV